MDVGLALEAESSSAIDAALLPRNCAVLSAPDELPGAFGPRQPRTDFYVVGTAHVSAGSCDDVRRVVQLVHPDVRARARACPARLCCCNLHVPNAGWCTMRAMCAAKPGPAVARW